MTTSQVWISETGMTALVELYGGKEKSEEFTEMTLLLAEACDETCDDDIPTSFVIAFLDQLNLPYTIHEGRPDMNIDDESFEWLISRKQ